MRGALPIIPVCGFHNLTEFRDENIQTVIRMRGMYHYRNSKKKIFYRFLSTFLLSEVIDL